MMNGKDNKLCGGFCIINGERWNGNPCSLTFEKDGIEISLWDLRNPKFFNEFTQDGKNYFYSMNGWNSSELGFRDKLENQENRKNAFASENQRRQIINSILELEM